MLGGNVLFLGRDTVEQSRSRCPLQVRKAVWRGGMVGSLLHCRYIEAAAKLGHMQEVERVVRESQYYDPVKVKDFLKEAKLQDPRPLIYVCDMHGYVEELTDYLYSNNLMK